LGPAPHRALDALTLLRRGSLRRARLRRGSLRRARLRCGGLRRGRVVVPARALLLAALVLLLGLLVPVTVGAGDAPAGLADLVARLTQRLTHPLPDRLAHPRAVPACGRLVLVVGAPRRD